MSRKLCFSVVMFGDFSINYEDNVLSDKGKYSKKCLSILEYLFANRKNRYSNNDIIDVFWPDDTSENPLGALKTLLHRTRTMLKNAGYPDNMIIQSNGTYCLNNEYSYEVDFEELDLLNQQLTQINNKSDRLALYHRVFQLYQGSFLSKSSYESWVLPINAYYHSLYLKLMNEYITLLLKEEEYNLISTICCRALSIDNFDEDLHYYFIYALYKSGKQSAAIEQYNLTIDLLRTKYNVTPSERFIDLYKQITNVPGTKNNDLNSIKDTLKEKNVRKGGFFCVYVFFKEVYQLVVRGSKRSGEPTYLCLLSIENQYNGILEKGTIDKAMEYLFQSILSSLRNCDIFSQYSPCQFILLLPNTGELGGKIVLNRIMLKFQTINTTITKVTIKSLSVD